MRIPSPDIAKNGSYIHWLNGHKPADLPPQLPPKPNASLERLDQVYRYVLGCLTLDDRHLDNLLARGLSPEAIAKNGYRTLPLNGRGEIVKKVINAVGTPEGVPGFFRRYGVWELAGWPGMLIPAKSPDGLIQGLQIRLDKPGNVGKYAWLSSAALGGWGPGAPAHVARPTKVTDRDIWITEGPLKADVATEILGAVMIGVAGAANWKEALATVSDLSWHETEQGVVIAFDQDDSPQTAENVRKHRDKLAQQIRESGMKAYWARWDVGKGIDDAKAAGAKVEILPVKLPEEKS